MASRHKTKIKTQAQNSETFSAGFPASTRAILTKRLILSRLDWGPVVVALGLIVLYSLLPLGTAIEFGGDEGIELMKGLLVSKGYKLYTQIWNDQPPVLTMLLSLIFRVCGPSILAARLLAALFGTILFLALYQAVQMRSNRVAAGAAVFFLAAAPGMLQLSSSVMLEVPAIGTAVVSMWLLFGWVRKGKLRWLLFSGAVMGIALQIKLTAVIVAPAICLEILAAVAMNRNMKALAHSNVSSNKGLATTKCPNGKSVFRSALRAGLSWVSAVALTSIVIGFLFAKGSLASSWRSHTGTQHVSGMPSPDDFRFRADLFLKHLECLAGAVVGAAILFRGKRFRELQFPCVLLITSLLIHFFHRPWWPYYYLHLAVPLAWLSGIAFAEIVKRTSQLLTTKTTARLKWWKLGTLSILAGGGIVVSEMRLEGNVRALRVLPIVNGNPIVQKMRQFAPKTDWVYAQPEIYAFHAGLRVPPELTVVVLKRFWSGQINTIDIIETCRRYKVEQLVLYESRVSPQWKEFLTPVYVLAERGSNCLLYASQQLTGSK